MRVHRNGNWDRIVLSRRNLLALLHKLDQPESARSLMRDGVMVTAESNTVHYQGGAYGEMTPDTEAFISQQQGEDKP